MKIFLYFTLFFAISGVIHAQENCVFEYNPDKTTLEWTAFKFTEKTGVKGKFDTIKVSSIPKSSDETKLFETLQFRIDPSEVNSGLPDRDQKIRKYFFNVNSKNQLISGGFSKIEKSKSGSAILNLNYKGVKSKFPVTFSWESETVTVLGTIDVISMGLGGGLKKLNEVCLELHKGKDGTSKLWPTVDFKIVSTVTKVCK